MIILNRKLIKFLMNKIVVITNINSKLHYIFIMSKVAIGFRVSQTPNMLSNGNRLVITFIIEVHAIILF